MPPRFTSVTAQKFMANNGLAGVAKTGVVIAQVIIDGHDHGVFPIVTPLRDLQGPPPGVRIRPLPESPYSPMDYSTIEFDDVRVPATALLGDGAGFTEDGRFSDRSGARRNGSDAV